MKHTYFSALGSALGGVLLLAATSQAQNPSPALVAVNLPFSEVRQLAAVAPETSRPILAVTLASGKKVMLPLAADAWFWKEKVEDHSKDGSLATRDGRMAQTLLKPDLSALPQDAVIEKARLEIFVGWQQKPGGATVKVHRMLSDWAETASWAKPFPDGDKTWDGMKPGTDFELAPAASLEIKEVQKGKIAIEGLEDLVRGWVRGTPNYGFTLQTSGKAVQLNFDSRESKERTVAPLLLGGPDDLKLFLRPDAPLMQSVLLKPDDLKDAALRLNLSKMPGPDKRNGLAVAVYRPLKADLASPPVAGVDYEEKPLATAPLAELTEDKWLRIPGVLPALQKGGLVVGYQVDMAVAGLKGQRPQMQVTDTRNEKSQPQLEVSINNYPKAVLFENPVKPRPGVYNQMKDGHFNYGGQRLRLWGTLGWSNDADRLRKMGFNAWRLWRSPKFYTPESAKRGEVMPVDPKAKPDVYDKFFASLKKNGMFVMFAGLTGTIPLRDVAVDGSFVAPAETATQTEKDDWAAWRDAVKVENTGQMENWYVYFDPRIQTIRKRHIKNFLTHVNPLTGKTYAQDENIALYETFNESAFVKKTLDRGWDKWHPYFRSELQAKWNEWLKAKYKDDAGRETAWGKVDESETFAGNAVKLGPASAKANEYPVQRGADFTRFLSELVINFNLDLEKYCRSFAPKGVGINVIPFSFDTQYMPSVQWAYQRSTGQVNSFGMYSWDTKSTLGRPPGNYVMDSHDVEGKATVIYETNQSRSDPFRTEYPFRTAALAAWQDWDGVFWHYWGAADFNSDEDYLTKAMPYISASHFWSGVHHQNDPAMTEAMAMAGRMFLDGAIAPAPNPVVYEIGAKAIFEFNRYNNIGLTQTTYSKGSRLRFKPESDTDVRVNGGPLPDNQRIREAVQSGEGVLWDWPNERLIIDTPLAKAYIGKTVPSHTFKDGTTVSGFNTPFVSWSLISADGKPLSGPNATQKAYINAHFDARNTGFDTDWNFSGGPVEQANVIRNRGRAPIIVDKVSFTVAFPTKLNAELGSYDFALRQIHTAKINASNVVRVKNSTAWMNVLSVNSRGDAAAPVSDPSPGAPQLAAAGGTGANRVGADKLASVFNPLPAVSWGDDYRTTHRILREAPTRFVAISGEDRSPTPQKTILWTGGEVLFDAPADFEVSFDTNLMTKIVATFKRPPDFPAAVAAYEAKFGPALEKVLDKAQFETNVGRWQVKSPGRTLNITLSQSQGEMKASYEFKAG